MTPNVIATPLTSGGKVSVTMASFIHAALAGAP
jgi:hypothetical protein